MATALVSIAIGIIAKSKRPRLQEERQSLKKDYIVRGDDGYAWVEEIWGNDGIQ